MENTLTNEYHELAKSKGWHDSDEMGPDGTPSARQRLAWIALVLTELKEAREAWGITNDPPWYIASSGKPEGLLSEVVDIWIRCADTLGACGYGNSDIVSTHQEDNADSYLATSLVAFLLDSAVLLGSSAECARTGDHVGYANNLLLAMGAAESYGGSLSRLSFAEAVATKHAYNAKRSQRHGGKLA